MFWLGAIVALCYVPGFTGAYIATQWPVLSAALSFDLLWMYAATQWPEVAALLWFYPPRKGVFTIFHALGLAFIAYAAVRARYSVAPDASVFGLWQIAVMALALWFGSTLKEVPKTLYAGLAFGAAVSSFVAVMQHFGLSWPKVASQEVAGLYVNSVQLGTVLAIIVVALISRRMWWWVLPLVPGIALSHSRGAWTALAVGTLACRFRRLWVLGFVGAVGAFYFFSPLSGSDVQRMQIWAATWENLSWSGAGSGVMFAVLLPHFSGGYYFPEYTHNDALQLAFEYGLAAVVPYAIFGYAIWRTDAKDWPVIAAFVTAGCYSMPLYMPIVAFFVFIIVGNILRLDGLDGHKRNGSRFDFLSLRRLPFVGMRASAVSVASGVATEGRSKWQQ